MFGDETRSSERMILDLSISKLVQRQVSPVFKPLSWKIWNSEFWSKWNATFTIHGINLIHLHRNASKISNRKQIFLTPEDTAVNCLVPLAYLVLNHFLNKCVKEWNGITFSFICPLFGEVKKNTIFDPSASHGYINEIILQYN